MSAPDPTPAPKSPSGLILGAIAIALGSIGTCAAYFLWPRGDLLGTLDLQPGTGTLEVDVGAGDVLNFRFGTVTVGTAGNYPDSSRSRTNKVHDELKASVITITAASKGTTVEESTCGAFAGKATTGSSESERVVTSGVPVDCSLTIPAAGTYTLTAKVAWVPKDVREAVLETRRTKAGK